MLLKKATKRKTVSYSRHRLLSAIFENFSSEYSKQRKVFSVMKLWVEYFLRKSFRNESFMKILSDLPPSVLCKNVAIYYDLPGENEGQDSPFRTRMHGLSRPKCFSSAETATLLCIRVKGAM